MKSSLGKNIIYQTLYQILVIILPLITSPYISRVLGAENLGIYSYTNSVANYFVLVAALGITNHGSRAIAAVREDKDTLASIFTNLFALHSFFSIVAIIAYVGYLFYIPSENWIYSFIQLFYVISALLDINWFFFGIEQFKLTVTRNTVIKVLSVLCVFLFVKSGDDLWKYCLIMVLGQLISQSMVWMFLKKYTHFVKPSWKEMQKHLVPMIALFIPAIAVSLYKIMDKIMLGNMSTKTEVGFYENSEKIINILMGVISAFGTVMLPKMSNLFSSGKREQAVRYMNNSVEVIVLISMALSFGVAAVADIFAPWFWGTEFYDCADIMSILAISVPFVALANVVRTQFLIPNHYDRAYLISVTAGAIVNIVVNTALIPQYSACGAAIGTICAEGAVCIIQVWFVKNQLPLKAYAKYIVVFGLDGVLMYLVVRKIICLMKTPVISLFAGVLVGALIYLGVATIYLVRSNNISVASICNHLKKEKR